MNLPIALLCLTLGTALAAEPVFRAGAARADITPPKDAALTMSGYAGREAGFKSIHDHLFVRAVAVDDGAAKAVIILADLSSISNSWWERLAAAIHKETGIPRDNILLAATHTHAGPSLGRATDDGPSPNAAAYQRFIEEKFVEATRAAVADLRPARVGAGAGRVNVNVNRRARVARGGLWLGRNPDGPSDKTLAVVKFETTAGDPIAIFMNYGVHATVMGSKNFAISGDLAGAASRHVEAHFGGKVVAPWSSGAAGDQAPIYSRAESFDDVEILGRLIGEEAIRAASSLRMSSNGRIRGAQNIVTCPGQKVPAGSRRKVVFKVEDAPPLDIRLSLLRVNDIAFAGVAGEVLTMIAQRLKKESPLAHTIMVTNCNGSTGYLPDDAAYDEVSYEIVSAPVKRGCAEKAIVDGFLDLIDRP